MPLYNRMLFMLWKLYVEHSFCSSMQTRGCKKKCEISFILLFLLDIREHSSQERCEKCEHVLPWSTNLTWQNPDILTEVLYPLQIVHIHLSGWQPWGWAAQTGTIDHTDIPSAHGPTPPAVTSPVFCLVTLHAPLPPSDVFLGVSTDLISLLIKYLPCPATTCERHLHTSRGGCWVFPQASCKKFRAQQNMEAALHHNICLVRPLGMQQTCK